MAEKRKERSKRWTKAKLRFDKQRERERERGGQGRPFEMIGENRHENMQGQRRGERAKTN